MHLVFENTDKLRMHVLNKFSTSILLSKYLRFRTWIWIRKRTRLIETNVEDFLSKLNVSTSKTVFICYNNTFSPPTFGDYFAVLMLARFLALSGVHITFSILDQESKRETHWNYLSSLEQEAFLQLQLDLAKKFLPEAVDIKYQDLTKSEPDSAMMQFDVKLGDELLPSLGEFFKVAPYFLDALIMKHGWEVPVEFLLRKSPSDVYQNFIAWHVRRGRWDDRRDLSKQSILVDLKQLKVTFPEHSIMLFSDETGLDSVCRILTGKPNFGEFTFEGMHIIPQPKHGIREAIPLVLAADFYYQRSGGGIGMVPIYTDISYIQICADTTTFVGKRKDKIVPWATNSQVFHHTWRDIENFKVENLFEARKIQNDKN